MEEKNKKTEKSIKSVNLSKDIIEKVDNYTKQYGASFSDVTEKGLELFFEALERGNNSIVETLGIDNPENSILVPLSLYLKMNNITHTQIYNLEKNKKVIIKTITEKHGIGNKSKSKFVIINEKSPEFYKAKITMMEQKINNINEQLIKTQEQLKQKIYS